MTQHRKGLFRHGNRWCSAAEMERLRREAAENGPEARKRLKRAELRCNLRMRVKVKIKPTFPLASEEGGRALERQQKIIQAIQEEGDPKHTWEVAYWNIPPDLLGNESYTIYVPGVAYDDILPSVKRVIRRIRRLFGRAWLVETQDYYRYFKDGTVIHIRRRKSGPDKARWEALG